MSEPTPEHVLNSVRGLLMWYGGGANKTPHSLRAHLRWCDPGVVLPADFHELPEEGHVGKAMFADILYLTFQAAALTPHAPAPPIQALKVVWRERICEYKTNEDRASLRDSEIAANAWMGKGMELRRCLDELVSANALTPPAPASASAPELQEMFSVVRSAGPAEWNVTAPMTADEHGAEFARMVRDTQALHGLDDSPRAVHWLSVKDGLSLAFVGCSPHSPHLARGLAGAWNRLVAECPAESETP